MSSKPELIDLTEDLPSNKRQKLAAGASELEASSSSPVASVPTRTGPHWGYPAGHPARKVPNKQKGAKANKALTSPELDVNLFELGTVQLPCEVAKSSQTAHSTKTSIHSLKQRLASYGFERRTDGLPDDFNGRLCLDNLFEREWKGCMDTGPRYRSTYIDLDSCPLEEFPPMPTQQRVEPVTLVYTDGSQAPITYGIHIDWSATNQQLSDAVQQQCDLPEDNQIVLVLLEHNRFDSLLRSEDPVPKRGKRLWSAWAGAYSPYSSDTSDAETSDLETSDSDASSSDDSHRISMTSVVPKCKKLNRTVAYIVPKPKPSAGTVIYRIVYTNSSALPLLIPVSSKFATGGSKEADKHVRAAIKTALTPAALATSDRSKPHKFHLNYCSQIGVNLMKPFAKVACDSAPKCGFDHGVVCNFGCLCAVWPQAELDMEYDMKILAEPAEHTSAAKDILDESSKGLVQLRKCDLAKAEAQDRPWQLVSDLQAAAKHVSAWPIIRVSLNLEPESDEPAEIRGTVVIKRFSITWVCKSIAVHVWVSQRRASSQQVMHFDMIASQVLSAHTHAVYNQSIDTCPWSCKFNRTVLDASRHLDLYPASLAMDHTKSFCVVKFKVPKVWCWRNEHVPSQHRLMQNLDDWSGLRDYVSYDLQAQSGCLKIFMHMLLKGQPHHDYLQAEVAKWSKRDCLKLRNLPGLMQLLQAEALPEADQPEGLTVALRPYQRQSLKFMMDNEGVQGGFRHHLFCSVANSKGERFWYSPVLGRICQDVAPMPQGGILGEEMGLGKTVEVAALILSRPAPPLQSAHNTTAHGLLISRATLVVCPVSLMGQWADELADKTAGSLKVLMHHGAKRSRDPKDLAEYDVVLVTYQTLGLEFSRGLKETVGDDMNLFPPCGSIQWHRIVLDEAHTVKNPSAQLTKACTALSGDKRWCVTGTPVGTDIADLEGQFNFLQLHPFANKKFFNIHVKPAYSGNGWGRGPAYVLLFMLGQCMIRHTKLQVLGGEEILQIPKKTEELVPVAFAAAEQELYMHVFERARTKYQMFRSQGPHMVSRRLIQIMSTLLPLRRICSGGKLSNKDLAVEMPESVGKVSTAVDPSAMCTEEACCICFESPLREPTRTKCNHWFCWECIGALLQASRTGSASLVCPLCRAKVQGQDLVKGVNEGAQALEEEDSFTAKLEERASTSESKLYALLEELRVMREREPSSKALVFSQFASTIEWLKVKLQEQGFGYRTISGSMTLKQRSKAIEAFQKDPPTTVFLLSMRSGSVGINLTSANHVFILEPALNPALEEQAVGRAWRMGQQREVTVKKFYVKGSVEERIMEMVQQRKEGPGGKGPGDKGQGPSTSRGFTWADLGAVHEDNARVKAQDIVGSMKADKQNLRMEELDLLFQSPSFETAQ